MMQLLGIDFTSAPRKAKPITCAFGKIEESKSSLAKLKVQKILRWPRFDLFEAQLSQTGPWTMAVDFPLGQPRRLVEALGWPLRWKAYVEQVAGMSKQEFCDLIKQYRDGQPAGDKHHLRQTDKAAGACSPMMLVGVPVGKMFFEGAPRVLRSGASVLPCQPNDSNRTLFEGYPKLVANYLLRQMPTKSKAKKGYKSDREDSQQRLEQRIGMLERCQAADGLVDYGVELDLDKQLSEQIIEDGSGDMLDALFCLIQAAAWHLDPRVLPQKVDALEGWIVDPTLSLPSCFLTASASINGSRSKLP